jgi:hypothetical protein
MRIDISGKIKEKRLAYSNTLLPLYEAIVNSIQAIDEESATNPGLISIELIRTPQIGMGYTDHEISKPSIIDFIIRDNGIGFNDTNFDSFDLAHSTYKAKQGGKGIGRIIWLRAFKKVEIESLFIEKGKYYKRVFNFIPSKDGIDSHEKTEVPKFEKRYTEVRLKGLKDDYQKWCNNDPEDIALRIIEHCFFYFLQKDCPRISIKDAGKEIFVNDLFFLYTRGVINSNKLKLRNLNFFVELVKVFSSRSDNKIHYCAHTREVENFKMSEEIPELSGIFHDETGEKYSLAAYVTGDYLNEKVNEERTEINFLRKRGNELEFQEDLTEEELRNAVIALIRNNYEDLIEQLSHDKVERIKNFVIKHPRYRYLFKYKKEDVKRIQSNLTDEKLEIELFKIQQKLDLEVKSETDDILKQIDLFSGQDDFKAKYSELYQKIIEVGNSKLSEYILYRKVILDILDKHLKKKDEDKFITEDMIHKMVFPLKSESDDVGYDDHNLWIIDERLAFHKYLASDKSFKQNKEAISDTLDRPDIIIYNKPFAFSDNEKPYSSIVIIEFKRPMRDDYNENYNPINQINSYARQIITGESKDKSGREFDLRTKTPIYAYIVCDLTSKMRALAENAGFTQLPDNNGYFHYNPNYSMYIEIISFDKLILDAKQRNKALFEKLNLLTV